MIVWYAREDSNLWPLAPEASALSAELRAQTCFRGIVPQFTDRHANHGLWAFKKCFEVAFAVAKGLPCAG